MMSASAGLQLQTTRTASAEHATAPRCSLDGHDCCDHAIVTTSRAAPLLAPGPRPEGAHDAETRRRSLACANEERRCAGAQLPRQRRSRIGKKPRLVTVDERGPGTGAERCSRPRRLHAGGDADSQQPEAARRRRGQRAQRQPGRSLIVGAAFKTGQARRSSCNPGEFVEVRPSPVRPSVPMTSAITSANAASLRASTFSAGSVRAVAMPKVLPRPVGDRRRAHMRIK